MKVLLETRTSHRVVFLDTLPDKGEIIDIDDPNDQLVQNDKDNQERTTKYAVKMRTFHIDEPHYTLTLRAVN